MGTSISNPVGNTTPTQPATPTEDKAIDSKPTTVAQSIPPTTSNAAPKDSTTRKADKSAEGKSKQTDLGKQLDSSRTNSSELQAKFQKIANDPNMKPAAKQAELQKLLDSANPGQFESIIIASRNWEPDTKIALSAALGESQKLMQRFGKEVSPEMQADIIGQIDTNSANRTKTNPNIDNWIRNAKPEILNRAIEKGRYDTAGVLISKRLIEIKDENLIGKLSDPSKASIITRYMKSAKVDDEFRQTAQDTYNNLDPKYKNSVIDGLQENGSLKNFLKVMPLEVTLNGVTPQNAGVISAEYYDLAKNEPKGLWNDMAHRVDGYAQNRFSKSDYEEYLRIRDHYFK